MVGKTRETGELELSTELRSHGDCTQYSGLLSEQSFSFIEYNGEGKELIENLVIIRSLDKELILQKIEQGKEFLLRAVHEDEHGFYKKYDTLNDYFGNRLHTVYSGF
ncbi:unnamed protein product, partial [marine sediment metagenome]